MDNEKENKITSKVVKTYAEDMAKVIEYNEGGLIKKIIHEQEEEELEKKNLSPASKKNQFFLYVSTVLVFITFGILGAYIVIHQKNETVEVQVPFSPLFYVDGSSFEEVGGLTKEQIIQTISNAANVVPVEIGHINAIYLTENKMVVGLSRFINLIKGNLILSKSAFNNDNFMMGVSSSTTQDFFFLLKVNSFNDAFPLVRSWENKMFIDLHRFFGYSINADTNYLTTKDYEDTIIENKNARVLLDKNNKIVLVYVFGNDTSLIITNTKEAAQEVLLRLSGAATKR